MTRSLMTRSLMTRPRWTQVFLCTLLTSAASFCVTASADDPAQRTLQLAQAQTAPADDAAVSDPNAPKDRKRRRQQDGQPQNGPPNGQQQPQQGQQPPPNTLPNTVTPVTPPRPAVTQPVVTPPAPPVQPKIVAPLPDANPVTKPVVPAPAKVVTPPPPAPPPVKNVVAPPAKPAEPAPAKVVNPVTPPTAPKPPVTTNATPPAAPAAEAAPPRPGMGMFESQRQKIEERKALQEQQRQQGAPEGAAAAAKPWSPISRLRNLQELQAARTQRIEAGGKRVIITEPDKRTIIKQNNQAIITRDEKATIQKLAPSARVENGKLGQQSTIIDRPNGQQVITETDRKGNLIRRFRRDADGKEQVIIDNRKRDKFGRNLAIGLGIGAGVVAGAAILNEITSVREPRVNIPRDKYIVRGEDASEDDVYEAFEAPPVDRIERRYSLDEVRATRHLRDRMRRVDLDDINFETGSWEVDPSEYRKLERVARAMRRVINRDGNEVFLIEGYTDAVGSDDDNLTLSDRRAEAVAEVLTREFQVPPENLTTQGYGEQYLKIDTDGPERANRRVALRRITPLIAQDAPVAAAPPRRDDDRDYRDRDDRDRDYRDRDRDYYRDRYEWRRRYYQRRNRDY